MKLISFFACAAAITSAAFLFGLAFDLHALALFGFATTASLLLVAVRDYVPASAGFVGSQPKPVSGNPRRQRTKYKLPFAA